MNKRITSLILCFALLLGVMLTGCSGETDTEGEVNDVKETASTSTITLTMYVVTKDGTTKDAMQAVENAFNSITQSKFKTKVKLTFCTYDEYYNTIEGVINDNMAEAELKEAAEKALKDAKKLARAQAITIDDAWIDDFYNKNPQYAKYRETEASTDTEETEAETVLNQYGFSELKYPEVVENQIDIVYIDSYDKYMTYIENEWLSRLDDEISAASKKLSDYISPSLMAWAKWAGNGTYAIPNNVVIGEYTYLLLNKKLVDKYNYDPTSLTSLSRCESFLNDIAKYEKSVLPVVGELPITLTSYWSVDPETFAIEPNTFSILGNTYNSLRTLDPTVTTNSPLGVRNIFKSTEYVAQLTAIQKYKDNGYITANTDTDKEYALRVVKGGAELVKTYGEDYYMNVIEYPRADFDTAFGNMFAVTTFTRSLSRSMEIITYLNTNSELRNILQYGVEGVHYDIDEETGLLVRRNNDYMMDINTTGNVFIAYPEEGMDADIWTYGKQQNLDSKSSLTLGFALTEENINGTEEAPFGINKSEIAELKRVSDEVWAKLQAVKNLAELEALIEECATINDTNAAIKNQTVTSSVTKVNAEGKEVDVMESIYGIYYAWMNDTKLYVPTE